MRPGSGSGARRALVPMIAVAVLSGCFDPGFDCVTLDEYDRIAASSPELADVIERKSVGEIVKEKPSTWRNFQFTGEICTVEIENRDGSTFVSISFLDEPVELKVPISERDFYMGLVDRNTAVVVQQVPNGTVATVTPFAEDGTLQYGACLQRPYWFRECHISPEPGG